MRSQIASIVSVTTAGLICGQTWNVEQCDHGFGPDGRADAAPRRYQPFQGNRADLAGQRHWQVAQHGRGSDALGDQLGPSHRADNPYLPNGNALPHIVLHLLVVRM